MKIKVGVIFGGDSVEHEVSNNFSFASYGKYRYK